VPKKPVRRIEIIKIATGKDWAPSGDEEARIIGGYYSHVTGTDSSFILCPRDAATAYEWLGLVLSTEGTCASYAVCPKTVPSSYSEERTSDLSNLWFGSDLRVKFSGGTASFVRVILEIVKIDPETGAHLA